MSTIKLTGHQKINANNPFVSYPYNPNVPLRQPYTGSNQLKLVTAGLQFHYCFTCAEA